MPALPEGLTERPLTLADARAVYEVMAAAEMDDIGMIEIEEADIVGDWGRPSFDVSAQTVGVFDDADGEQRLVGYAEVAGGDRGDAAVHPAYRGRGIGTRLARWMQDDRPRPRLHDRRHARAGGLLRRPAARGARLPRAAHQLGAQAARGRRDRPPRAARGVRRPRGPARRVARRARGRRGRVPRVVGARPRVLRGLRRLDPGPPRLRAVEPARRHRRRGQRSSASPTS